MTQVTTREGAQRRFGFVSLLLWVGFVFGTLDTVLNHRYTIFRFVYLTVDLLLASFMTYTWWMLKKGSDE
jgi:hypothetical protein